MLYIVPSPQFSVPVSPGVLGPHAVKRPQTLTLQSAGGVGDPVPFHCEPPSPPPHTQRQPSEQQARPGLKAPECAAQPTAQSSPFLLLLLCVWRPCPVIGWGSFSLLYTVPES